MAKKRLTQQQILRIKKSQKSKSAQTTQMQALSFDEAGLGIEQTGRIITHFGQQVVIEKMDSAEPITQRCHVRGNVEALVTGDHVTWRAADTSGTDTTGIVTSLLPRHSLLSRQDPHGGNKLIAANIDQLIIVIAPEPEPFANLIDRYLVAAEINHFTPIIVMNKTDLLHKDKALESKINSMLAIYQKLGYSVIEASSIAQEGTQLLTNQLKDKISIFVGQSGVGKSSLINRLLPDAALKVGELSKGKAKGTHTTTAAQLLHLPEGGEIIDSPGIREFGLDALSADDLAYGFKEMKPYLGQCKFRNCLHQNEAGCAIEQAVKNETVYPERYQSYRDIFNSFE